MNLFGNFIEVVGHKEDKVFPNKKILLNIDSVALVATLDDGILTLSLQDGTIIMCEGAIDEFCELVSTKS